MSRRDVIKAKKFYNYYEFWQNEYIWRNKKCRSIIKAHCSPSAECPDSGLDSEQLIALLPKEDSQVEFEWEANTKKIPDGLEKELFIQLGKENIINRLQRFYEIFFNSHDVNSKNELGYEPVEKDSKHTVVIPLRIDLMQNIKLQLWWVEYSYYSSNHDYMLRTGKKCLFDSNKTIGEVQIMAEDSFSKAIVALMKLCFTDMTRFKNRNRACGLWLWDYVKKRSTPGAERFSGNQAIEAFAKRFPDEKEYEYLLNEEGKKTTLDKDTKIHRNLQRYLKVTSECIEKGEVLKIK